MLNLNLIIMKQQTLIRAVLCVAVASSFVACKKSSVAVPESKISVPKTVSTSFTPLPTNLSVGLVAYWAGTNNAYDFSGNGYNPTTINAVTVGTDHTGNINGAFVFNGTSSYISVHDNLMLRLHNADYTMNAWVYLVGYNSGGASIILGKRGTGPDNGWSWGLEGATGANPGYLVFNPGSTPLGFAASAVATGGWHMITTTYSFTGVTGTMNMYIDGVLSKTTTGVPTSNLYTTNLLYMGMDDPSTGAGYFLNGRLDNVRIYDQVLDITAITALRSATTAPTSGLVAFWPLSNTTNDVSGNSYNGTATALTPFFDRFTNNIGAYEFDGTTSSVAVADAAPLRLGSGSFALNAWVKLYSYSSTASIIMGKRVVGTGNSGWSWGITNTGYLNFSNGLTNTPSNATISTGSWHMVTVSYDYANSQKLSIYIDNVLHGSATGVSNANASTTASLYVGRDNPGGAYFFDGELSDLRIYNRALSVTDVNNLYSALN